VKREERKALEEAIFLPDKINPIEQHFSRNPISLKWFHDEPIMTESIAHL
jgi:hypothetical protein